MVKPEWGQKRICQSCGAKFYDMRRNPIVCPKCEAVFDPVAQAKPRRRSEAAAVQAAPVADKAPVAEEALEPADDDIEEISDEDEEEDETIEDASELGEDDDDMAEVMENLDEDEER